MRAAAARLAQISDTARLDAELLMAHALGVSRSEMLLRHGGDDAPIGFAELVERRARHEPVAYLIGRQEFYGLEFEVEPGVLIPRADSETLIEAARLGFTDRAPPTTILDLGTGPGTLLLAALSLWPEASGHGVDRSPAVIGPLRRNIERHAPGRAVAVELADWTRPGWADGLGRFDLILANPPYVETGAELSPTVREWEPAEALFAGADGLDDYRVLVPQLPGLLAADGIALVEIGAAQGDAVVELARQNGLAAQLHRDLAGRPRAVELHFTLGKHGASHYL